MPSPPRQTHFDSTLAFMADPYRFILKQARQLESELFSTRILLQETLCMVGPQAAEFFYDTERFHRSGAAPGRVIKTLFGDGGVQGLDGLSHRLRKEALMSLMTAARIDKLRSGVREALRSEARKASGGETIAMLALAERALMRAVCDWAAVPLAENEIDQRTRAVSLLFEGAGAIGPLHWRSRLARKQADRWAESLIDGVRAKRSRVPADSPLAQIAVWQNAHGRPLETHAAAVELLNIIRPTVAVSVWMVFLLHAIHQHGAPDTDDDVALRAFVQEVRRFYPFFPVVGALTSRDLEWRGMTLPEGTRTLLALWGTNNDPAVWSDPQVFDPTRITSSPPGPYELIPQGGGDYWLNHRCAGERISLALMEEATRFLTRDVVYEVPPQDLDLDWRSMPGLPKGGMRIKGLRLRD